MGEFKRKRRLVVKPEENNNVKAIAGDFEEDPSAKILNDQIFSNPLVTDCILKNLSTPDILSCSAVAKNWNTAAREFLLRKRNCLMKIKLGDIRGFNDSLNLLRNNIFNYNYPYTGVYVLIKDVDVRLFPRYWKERQTRIRTQLELVIEWIFIQHVVICYEGYAPHLDNLDEPIKFVLPLLPVSEIESLRISGIESIAWRNLLFNIPAKGFSKLTTIRTDYRNSGQTSYMPPEDYEAILFACPALTELRMTVESYCVTVFENYGKLELVKSLHVLGQRAFTVEDKNFQAIVRSGIPLEVLSLARLVLWQQNHVECMKKILLTSSKVLREIRLDGGYDDLCHLKLLVCPQVTKVVVKYRNYDQQAYNDQDICNHPNLKRLFPNANIIPCLIN